MGVSYQSSEVEKNLVKILLLLAATPEDGVVPEMWVLLTHLSVESSLFVSCWCLCR